MFGFQPSLLLNNMTSGTQWGAMNLYFNQVWADNMARQTLYMTPTMDWTGCTQYSMPGGSMSYLLDPAYTIGQWSWNNFANTALNGGMSGMGWNSACMGNMGWGNMGWNGSPFPGSTTTTPATTTAPKNDTYASKYNRLLTLVKQLVKNGEDILDNSQIEILQNASRATGKTNEEKYNNLKAAYDEAIPDKTAVKEFLTKSSAGNISVDGKETQLASSVYKNLQDAGFEFLDSPVDDHINELYNTINNLSSNVESWDKDTIIGQLGNPQYDILDVISSWNSKAGNDKDHLMKFIATKYNDKLKGSDNAAARDSFKTGVIQGFVNQLEKRARGLMSKLDADSQAKLQSAIDELQTAFNGIGDTINVNSLSDAFDNLYLMTRQAATEQLRNKMVSYYRDIDPDVFNDDLFVEDMKEDLQAEGFSDTQIAGNKVTVRKSGTAVNPAPVINSNDPLDKQIKDSGVFTERTAEGIDDVTTVYEDKNTGKFYVIEKDEDDQESLHEITGVKVQGDKVVADGTPTISPDAVTVKDVERASRNEAKRKSDEAKKAQDLATCKQEIDSLVSEGLLTKPRAGSYYEETSGQKRCFRLNNEGKLELLETNDYETKLTGKIFTAKDIKDAHNKLIELERYNLADDQKQNVKTIARDVYSKLDGLTRGGAMEDVEDYIDNDINKYNVMYFLNEYEVARPFGGDYFFEQLQSENHDDREITSQKVVKYVLDYIDDNLESITDLRKKQSIEADRDRLKKLYSELGHDTKGKQIDKIIFRLIKNFDIKKV